MGPLRIPFSIGVSVVRRVGGAGIAAVRAILDRGHSDDDRFASVPTAPPPPPGARPVPPPFEPPPFESPPFESPPLEPRPFPSPPVEPPPFESPSPGVPEEADVAAGGGFARDLPAEEAELVAEVGDPDDVGASVHVEGEPFPGYDALRAPEIVARLGDADESTRARVRLYEQANKRRKTILDATRR